MSQRRGLRINWWILLFVTPGLAVVVSIVILPLFMSLFNSMFAWEGIKRLHLVGFKHFIELFTGFPYRVRFTNALRNNLIWFVSQMLLQNTVALLFGYLLSRKIRGAEAYKRTFFIPVIFSLIAVGFLWNLYLSPTTGIINLTLRRLGLASLALPWLGDVRFATPTIIVVNMWRWVGFPTLVFYAGINKIPAENVEAAYLDGVGEWRLFWRIIFPLIMPSITIITILTFTGSLNVFEQIYVMTGVDGGPYYSTDTLGTLFYRTAFGDITSSLPNIGIGSAIGFVLYVLTFATSVTAALLLRRREVEL